MTDQTDTDLAVVAAEQAVTNALRNVDDLGGFRVGLRLSAKNAHAMALQMGFSEAVAGRMRATWDALDELAAVVQREKEGR